MKKYLFFPGVFIGLTLYSFVCIAQGGIITTVAGNGIGGFSGDGGAAMSASLQTPYNVTFDTLGNMYIADMNNLRVRKVNIEGVITTIAGNGASFFSGDGGMATLATMRATDGVAVDHLMNIYIADENNQDIRKVNSAGIISSFAGGPSASGLSDGRPATACVTGYPKQVAVDKYNNVYIAASVDNSIRKVDTFGIIHTLAGINSPGGIGGYSGDGGPATAAQLSNPCAVFVDILGNAYIADYYNARIRKVDTLGIITTFAGNGTVGFSGDGGPATAASIAGPSGIVVDDSGNVYIADVENNRVRKVNAAGIITTIAGNGVTASTGDEGPALCAELAQPRGLSLDKLGNLYISEQGSNRIREINFHPDYVRDSFAIDISKLCSGPALTIVTNNYTPSMSLVTWFGDGSQLISTFGSCGTNGVCNVLHTYNFPGTYRIKQILYRDSIAIDSIQYSYEYLLCNNYTLKFFNDYDGDCIKDGIEPFSGFPTDIEVDSNSIPIDTISGLGGIYYTAFGSTGDIYSFKILTAPPGLYISCPSSGVIKDTIQSGMYNNPIKYFALNCIAGAAFDLAEFSTMKTGRHMQTGSILVNNSFCNPETATISMRFSPQYNFESAYPTPLSVIGNIITWDLGTLSSTLPPPAQIGFTLQVPTPAITSTWLTPGDTISSTMVVTPFIGDIDTINNKIARNDTVKSSYDPNEMSVTPQGYILSGSTIQYAIDFENTGNDTAHNIYIMDTLSPDIVLTSIRPVAATSTMNIAFISTGGYNIVKFDFPAINLLDSTHHNQCDGMVVFNIRTNPALTDGVAIFNHAGIFFDDNPVVITDTVESIISLITGPDILCVGGNITLSELAAGGTWSNSNSSATDTAGLITGLAAGIDTITYTITNQFGTTAASRTITVNPVVPFAGIITVVDSLCIGTGTTLTESVPSGIWSFSNSNASISGDIVTGVTVGEDSINYVVANTCGSASTSKLITIITLPTAGTIFGPYSVCQTASTSFSDSTAGGTWSAVNTNATVAAGTVTGITAGTDSIIYMVINVCGVATAAHLVTINPLPDAGAITGDSSVCPGATIAFTEDALSGAWSSSNATLATIDMASGFTTSLSAGIDSVGYTVVNSCGTMVAVKALTINPAPAMITGVSAICVDATASLTDAMTGGSWSSANTLAATIDAGSGEITGASAGSTTITYMLATGCVADTFLTVDPLPAPITGAAVICLGDSITLSDATFGGAWNSADTTIAVVGTSSGTVTGVSSGMPTITYIAAGCVTTATLTINPCPTGIQSIGNTHAIEIYPNPTHGELTIAATDKINDVAISNLLGQVVYSASCNENEVTVSITAIPSGVYFVKVNGAEVGKFVKE